MQKKTALRLGVLIGLVLTACRVVLVGQGSTDAVQTHIDAARAAAGRDFPGLFGQLCTPPAARPEPSQGSGGRARTLPDRSVWHVEPAKVFDNLYFVGEKEYSAYGELRAEQH